MKPICILFLLVISGCAATQNSNISDNGGFKEFSSQYWDFVESGSIRKIAEYSPILYGMKEKDRQWYLDSVISGLNPNEEAEIARVSSRENYCSFSRGNVEFHIENIEFTSSQGTFSKRYMYLFDSKYWYVGLSNKNTLSHFSQFNPRVERPQRALSPPACIREIMR